MDALRFRAALVRIARTMLSQGHGGTNWEEKVLAKRYAPTRPVTVVRDEDARHREYVDRCSEGRKTPEAVSILPDELIRGRFNSELEWLGRLTATDGMTVVLRDWTLLGFGVFFDTNEKADSVTRVLVNDSYDNETEDEPRDLASIGGARHQSAAVICKHFPGAIAIVASQDGSLSSMKWDAFLRNSFGAITSPSAV